MINEDLNQLNTKLNILAKTYWGLKLKINQLEIMILNIKADIEKLNKIISERRFIL